MSDEDAVEKFVERRMREYKSEVDNVIDGLRHDVQRLHSRVDELTADVHRITAAVWDISNSLKVIADSISRLSDLPVVWDRVKSFWMVTSWIQKNFFPLSVLIVLLVMLANDGGLPQLVRGLIP